MKSIDRPDWASYLEFLGGEVARMPPVEYGEMAPRIVVSVPTGRFTYWLLTSGALQQPPPTVGNLADGTRVCTWVGPPHDRMRDIDLSTDTKGNWQITAAHKVPAGQWPVAPVPPGTPEDRGGAKPARNYKDQLRNLPGRQYDWHKWYAQQCLRPVTIVGTGREHIQRQRTTLLTAARNWFPADVAALLDEDTQTTSNPERTMFHPFMVFDAGVGSGRPWLRAMQPRLVIVTSWSSHCRMHTSLFSRVPHIIITNRRVRSASDAVIELGNVERDSTLESQLDKGRPPGVFIGAFRALAQGDANELDDDDDLEMEI